MSIVDVLLRIVLAPAVLVVSIYLLTGLGLAVLSRVDEMK